MSSKMLILEQASNIDSRGTSDITALEKTNELVEKLNLPVIKEHQLALFNIHNNSDLDAFLVSIKDQSFEDQVVLSQAAFLSVQEDIEVDSWCNNAANFIGYMMAISGHTKLGKVKVGSKSLPESLKTFLEANVSETMDYDGFIYTLLQDFNSLAQNGYDKIVNLLLFDLVLASLDLDGNVDLGHREGWFKLLQQRAVDLRNGFSDMNDGWSYDTGIQDIEEIDLEYIESYEHQPVVERRFEYLKLDINQINELLLTSEFLPETHHANRLLRSMLNVSGFTSTVAVDIINYLTQEKEELFKLRLARLINKSKKLITRASASVFYKELAKNLRDMTGLNMEIWTRIHNILNGTLEVELPERMTTQVTADIKMIGEKSGETTMDDLLDNSFDFKDFMSALDDES